MMFKYQVLISSYIITQSYAFVMPPSSSCHLSLAKSGHFGSVFIGPELDHDIIPRYHFHSTTLYFNLTYIFLFDLDVYNL